MDKITQNHLRRVAYVYIRQSTLQQVQNNMESQRIQYGLVKKAQALGWHQIEVIDDDLGKSGTGKVKRSGFERLLSNICQGQAGAVFAMDASRLARNGKEWHTLLELCALMNTVIVDLEAVYDPSYANDRLLLGMKGTLSEMEVSLFRQRSQEALRQKALRGELYTTVAIGYVLSEKQLEKNPNKRIEEAISLVFTQFRELGSARQVLLWFREEQIELPTVEYVNSARKVRWKLPVYNTILKFLTNPIYAGAYAYGRTVSEVKIENGCKKVIKGKRLEEKDWQVLLKHHHEGYISWEEYKHNRECLRENANMKGLMVLGSIKKGEALLVGLLRCGHCGRKMTVHYTSKRVVRYQCRGAMLNHGTSSCISFGGLRVEEAMTHALLEVISPLGIEAAVQANNTLDTEQEDIRQQRLNALEQARYERDRRWRQFNAVEPENRLAAAQLEERWNQALEKVSVAEQALAKVPEKRERIHSKERQSLLALGNRIRTLWFEENTTVVLKKKIIRTLLSEIIASISDDGKKIILVCHWQGGVHTKIEIKRNKRGCHRYATDLETKTLITDLSRYMPDKHIAMLLTRLGKKTGKGNGWNESRVRGFRGDHKIPVYRKNEQHERGELLLAEVAQLLEIKPKTVLRLTKKQVLSARQICKGAPWVYKKADIDQLKITGKSPGKRNPCSRDQNQLMLEYSVT